MRLALTTSGLITGVFVLAACEGAHSAKPSFSLDRYLIVPLGAGIDSAVHLSLGGYLARDPRSWEVVVQDTSTRDWLYLKRQLLQSLTAISAGDTVGKRGTVTISRVRFHDDVALVRVRIVREFRCDLNQWLGFSAEYEIESRWRGSEWSKGIAHFVQSTDPPRCAVQVPTSNTR
jgi:hypothetical protein